MIRFIRRQLNPTKLIALVAAAAAIAAFITAAIGNDTNHLATIAGRVAIGLTIISFGVIVTGPLFSLSASGQLGKSLVYAEWNGRKYVREYVIPSNPNSISQQFQRAFFGFLSKWWAKAIDTNRESWQSLADAGEYSTFNAYCATNLDDETVGLFPKLQADGAGTTTSDDPTSITAVGGVNQITATITNPSGLDTSMGLMVMLGTDGGAASTAHSVNRTIAYRAYPNDGTTDIITIPHIPAGVYKLSAKYVEQNGGVSAWVDTVTAATVTGTP